MLTIFAVIAAAVFFVIITAMGINLDCLNKKVSDLEDRMSLANDSMQWVRGELEKEKRCSFENSQNLDSVGYILGNVSDKLNDVARIMADAKAVIGK